MQYIIGIVIGICIWHYWPNEAAGVAEKTQEIIHQGAAKAAELTAPKSTLDKIKEAVQ
jgi:hypothetical protein